MKPAPFRYIRPDNVAEAVGLLKAHGEDARVLAGGQSLGPMLNMRLATPAVLVDILGIEALRGIVDHGSHISIGTTVSQAAALKSKTVQDGLPLLARALPFVGHYQTRNRGTIGGSIAHSDPSAEIPLALLVLGGAVLMEGKRGRREVMARDFFLGPLVTARQVDELIVETRWPRQAGRWGASFQEEAIREGDFAITSCACALELSREGTISRLAIGFAGVGDRPVLADTDGLINARPEHVSGTDIAGLNVPGLQLRDDLHAGAAYRRHLMGWLGWQAFRDALNQAQERAHA